MGKESGIKRQTYKVSPDGREPREPRRLFAGCKLSSDSANVMKRDARNSATVSAVAPRFNSSA